MADAVATERKPKTQAPPKVPRVVALLDNKTLPAAEVIAKTSLRALARAWSRGEVELGRRDRCLNGRAGAKDSILHVECLWHWTGAKTPQHQDFDTIWAEEQKGAPEAAKYFEYPETLPADHPPEKSPLREISRAEAERMLVLHVKLTDRGRALLPPDEDDD